jgi:amidase
VSDAFWKAADRLSEVGVEVQEESLPIFKDAPSIWTGVIGPSTLATMESQGEGYWHMGYYDTFQAETFGRFRKTRANELPPMLKVVLIAAAYLRDEYQNRHYCKAQNLRRLFTEKVDDLLKKVDAIATPTTAIKPLKLSSKMAIKELAKRGLGLVHNTCPFNISGHPAISFPCGVRSNLPIGFQLVGRYWEEGTLLRAAYNFEQKFDWKKM